MHRLVCHHLQLHPPPLQLAGVQLAVRLNYDVDYKLNSSGTWINAATATASTSVNLSGLTASSVYNWRVRANCTAVGLSSTYAQAQFTTAAVVTCPGPLDVSTNGNAAGAATIPFNTDVKGLISPTNDNDYYKFVITTGGTATITLTTLPFDYDIKLYSSNGTTQLAISQSGGTTSETINQDLYSRYVLCSRVWVQWRQQCQRLLYPEGSVRYSYFAGTASYGSTKGYG